MFQLLAGAVAADPFQVSAMSGLLAFVPIMVLWVWCLVDVAQTDPRQVRTFTKQQWTVLVVLTSAFGGLLWLIFGRPSRPH